METLNNQRASHRLPVDGENQSAGIAIGRKIIKAQVLDQSRCGCKIRIPAKYKLEKNQEIRVATTQGQYIARVARVSADGLSENLVQVGLEFVGEYTPKFSKSNIAFGADQRSVVGGEWSMAFSGVFLLACVSGGLLLYCFRDMLWDVLGF